MSAVANEDVQRCKVAVERLPSMQLAEHLENAVNFPARCPFRPSLAGARQERAELPVSCVLEHETVEDRTAVLRSRTGGHQGKFVEYANRPRMSVEQVAEVRLA